MEKKIETLSRITTIMKDVIQNKDHIIAHLQQPYSLDCILVEAEFQHLFQISNGVIILRNLLQFGGRCPAQFLLFQRHAPDSLKPCLL
ncbi:AUGMIN subunit 2-like isoform X3 [Mangifera indica]|uniref:AUGMIN subunit 2-like isoform X3 n=1 Tax=Mangifera indica TaxID=29780 RepID=UPI001CF956C1|nr:AUGMIN subunit 2-like isoform X3 [Mangifera indica]